MFKCRHDFFAAACSQPVQASQLKSLEMDVNLSLFNYAILVRACLSGGLYCMLGGLKQL
ncbi:hypothetical protein Peur_047833 [Populus x canadensis]